MFRIHINSINGMTKKSIHVGTVTRTKQLLLCNGTYEFVETVMPFV